MNRKVLMLLLIVGLTLSGCITGTHNYSPPVPGKAENSIVVNKTKDEVWNGLVSKLEKDVFTSNEISKDSGKIRLSYSGDPEGYVDCGYVKMQVKDIHGKRFYNFPASRQNMTFEVADKGNLYTVKRNLDLEANIEVEVKAISARMTEVSVDCRYLLTKNSEITLSGGSVLSPKPLNVIDSVSFHTGETGSYTKSTGSCNPTYLLERRILKYAQ